MQKEHGLVVDGKYGNASKTQVEYLLKVAKSTSKIDTIKEVQQWMNTNYKMNIAVDGVYGKETKTALIKVLQTELNQTYNTKLQIDGVWGANTREACPTLKSGSKDDVVGVLQAFLICNGYSGVYLDGEYGALTNAAVRLFQGRKKITADGMAGKDTFAKLCS